MHNYDTLMILMLCREAIPFYEAYAVTPPSQEKSPPTEADHSEGTSLENQNQEDAVKVPT